APESGRAAGGEAATDGTPPSSTQPCDRTTRHRGTPQSRDVGHSLHQISGDLALEFPEVQIGTRTVKARSRSTEYEEMDSDEEWEQLIEATDPSTLQLSTPLALLRDPAFRERLRARLGDSSTQVLEGMLEGALRLRPALRVTANLLSTRCDGELLHGFCCTLGLPDVLLQLCGPVVHSIQLRELPWRCAVLCDLLCVLSAYFACEFSTEPGSGVQEVDPSASQFLTLFPQLLSEGNDQESRVKERTLTCLILLCETMDRTSQASARRFYESLLSEHQAVLIGVLQGHQEVTEQEGSEGSAAFRDRLQATYTAALSALCHVPPGAGGCPESKRKLQVAHYVDGRLFPTENAAGTNGFLKGINEQSLALDTLKVLYSCCTVSKDTCHLVMDEAVQNLLVILENQVSPDEPVQSQTRELSLYLLSLMVIQLDRVPDTLEGATGTITAMLLRSTAHTSAAALLLIELSSRGCSLELLLEDFLQAALVALTSTFQLSVVPPLHRGMLDGLLMLLLQIATEGDAAVLQCSEVWPALWQRVAHALRLCSDGPVMEGETPRPGRPTPAPDWSCLSPSGLLTFLSLATLVFTAVPQQCVPLLSSPTTVVLATLGYLLSEQFLAHLNDRLSPEPGGGDADCASCVVLRVCQILCFPFAVDVEEPLYSDVLLALLEGEMVRHLVKVSLCGLPAPEPDLPLWLLCRLSLCGPPFLGQLQGCLPPSRASSLLHRLLGPPGTLGPPSGLPQLLALLAQMPHSGPGGLSYLREVLGGPGAHYRPLLRALSHPEAWVRSQACRLASGLLAGGREGGEALLPAVLARLRDPEPGVRARACVAAGNGAYQAGPGACGLLPAALPLLLSLLGDGSPRARSAAAWGLANLSRGGGEGAGEALLRAGAPQLLLRLACGDQQPHVVAAALGSLRGLCRREEARQVLLSLKAPELLSQLRDRTRQKASLSTPGTQTHGATRDLLHHCSRLLDTLK
ncbi:serine/threonine-protein kinase 36-like, partial [Pristis pectinata]|uniref:serine/threonine-protein kinase 36-like n=1 Tax=Pristis pectinata TaxID=685728 RepID=UPI00223D6302